MTEKNDNSSTETTLKNDKLSILLDNTGFHSLGPVFGIDIGKNKKKTTPKFVINKRLLHLLGAFLLSDEITLVKPETELKDVKDVSSEILKKLEPLGSKNSTEDLVRQFDYVENAELEEEFRSASRELAKGLSSFINKPDQLNNLIRQIKEKKLLPGKVKSANLPYDPNDEKYKNREFDDLKKIWESNKDSNFPYAHVYMIHQEELNETLKELRRDHKDINSLFYEFLHTYFSNERNKVFLKSADSLFYAPAYDRSWLMLEGLKFSSQTSRDRRDVERLKKIVLAPSLSLMGLWAISKHRHKTMNSRVKEILKESRSQDSSTDVMENIKDFRKSLLDYIQASKEDFPKKYKKHQEKVELLEKEIIEELTLNNFFKKWYKDMKDAFSVADFITMGIALSSCNIETMITISTIKTMPPFVVNIYNDYSSRKSRRSILDDMHLANDMVGDLFSSK